MMATPLWARISHIGNITYTALGSGASYPIILKDEAGIIYQTNIIGELVTDSESLSSLLPDFQRFEAAAFAINEVLREPPPNPSAQLAYQDFDGNTRFIREWYFLELPAGFAPTSQTAGQGRALNSYPFPVIPVDPGGPPRSLIDGTPFNDSLFGSMEGDLIRAFEGDDNAQGNEGNDEIYGGEGNDILTGNDGNDRLFGGAGGDNLTGGSGSDAIHGESGDDNAQGNEGNDVMYGGDGSDIIAGNDGDDRLFGGAGGDKLTGGAGTDVLRGGSGADLLEGEAGPDVLYGGGGADLLRGGGGFEQLFGGDGADILYGGAGKDQIFAGAGNDIIIGGSMDDYIVGGGGTDIYVLYTVVTDPDRTADPENQADPDDERARGVDFIQDYVTGEPILVPDGRQVSVESDGTNSYIYSKRTSLVDGVIVEDPAIGGETGRSLLAVLVGYAGEVNIQTAPLPPVLPPVDADGQTPEDLTALLLSLG